MANDTPTLSDRVRTIRSGKAGTEATPERARPGHTRPTTFSLYKETELPSSNLDERADGRASAKESNAIQSQDIEEESRSGSDNAFGVTSLHESIKSDFEEISNPDDMASMPHDRPTSPMPGSVSQGKKRKAGNPVHPKIVAAGQRIISSEGSGSSQASSTSSSVRPEAPARLPSSGIRTRLQIPPSRAQDSPADGSPASGTPDSPIRELLSPLGDMLSLSSGTSIRSTSPASMGLTDDERAESGNPSPAILSSDSEEGSTRATATVPQLRMPSIELPARKPFTQRGRRMGRLNIVVAGDTRQDNMGFVKALLDASPDIVKVDETLGDEEVGSRDVIYKASTKPRPSWKKIDGSIRDEAPGEALDQNISITIYSHDGNDMDNDVPGQTLRDTTYRVEQNILQSTNLEALPDPALLRLMSGDGGDLIDLILFLIRGDAAAVIVEGLTRLSGLTNVLPLLIIEDGNDGEDHAQWDKINLHALDENILSRSASSDATTKIRHIKLNSHVLTDQSQATAPQDTNEALSALATDLFYPDILPRLRYIAACKALKCRHNLLSSVDDKTPLPFRPQNPFELIVPSTNESAISPDLTCSTISTPSGILVPLPNSSFYDRPSSSLSAHTIDSTSRVPSGLALTTLDHHLTLNDSEAETKEVRLAQWALDFQRSLEAEHFRQTARWTQTHDALDAIGSQLLGADTRQDGKALEVHRGSSSKSTSPTRACEKRTSPTRRAKLPETALCDPLGLVGLGTRWRKRYMPLLLRVVGVGAALGTLVVLLGRYWNQDQNETSVRASTFGPRTYADAMGSVDRETSGLEDIVDSIGHVVGELVRPVFAIF